MRRLFGVLVVVALAAALLVAAGCSESDAGEASTPAGAPTVANSALQTDSAGKTITAPPATTPGGTPPSGGGGEVSGDAAAGGEFFAGICQSCHLNGGKDAGGIGPQLAEQSLTPAYVTDVVTNGIPGTAMRGGLATGADLDDVIAYVVSLQ